MYGASDFLLPLGWEKYIRRKPPLLVTGKAVWCFQFDGNAVVGIELGNHEIYRS